MWHFVLCSHASASLHDMSVMPIYGKSHLKIFLSRTKIALLLNPVLWPFFAARLNLPPHTFIWENVEKSFSENVLKSNGWKSQYIIKVRAKPFSCSENSPGLYTCIKWIFQTTSILKPLDLFSPNFIWRFLSMEEWHFVQMVTLCWPRCLSCPNHVKIIFSRTKKTRRPSLDI